MLGTNKMASVFGTGTSAITYARKIKLEQRLLWPTVGLALVGSGAGAVAALAVSASALKPIIIAVLLAVLVLVIVRPQMGLEPQPKLRTPLRAAALMLTVGVGIAFYDGIIGPGTGIFLSIAFTTIIGSTTSRPPRTRRSSTLPPTSARVTVFALQGNVWWVLGLTMGVGCMLGAWFGARTAMARGSGFVRVVLVVVVLGLLARLSWDVWNTWQG